MSDGFEKLNWEKVADDGYDLEAKTRFGTYTISVDHWRTGGTCYLWLAGQGESDDPEADFGTIFEAKSAAQEAFECCQRAEIIGRA